MGGHEFVFVDELPGGVSRTEQRDVLAEFARVLRKRPNRWARYPIPTATSLAARAAASRITRGASVTFGRGFRATARGTEVYVRYEGVEVDGDET